LKESRVEQEPHRPSALYPKSIFSKEVIQRASGLISLHGKWSDGRNRFSGSNPFLAQNSET
jgi:hypothetical protein